MVELASRKLLNSAHNFSYVHELVRRVFKIHATRLGKMKMPPEGGILNVKVIWFCALASSLGHQKFLDYDVLAIGKSDLVHAALQVAGRNVE